MPTPSPSHLTEDQRGVLQKALWVQLDAMERDSQVRLRGETQAEHAHEVSQQDPDDATQRAGAHEVEDGVADIDSAEFEALRSALRRIHGPSYGVCADCGEPIPFERLVLEPQAMRCEACAALHERRNQP